jgi:hypothetical protein
MSVYELACNLKTLIKQAVVKIQESGEKEHMFVGKRVRYRFNKECDGKTETAWLHFVEIILRSILDI